jgi:hypothetical protein
MRKKEDIMSKTNAMKMADHKGKSYERGADTPVQALLNGSFLTRNRVIRLLPYLLFLTFLAVIYISNVYYGERLQRETDRIQRELKEDRYEYITTKSRLMFKSKQSEVARDLDDSGVKESTVPPVKVIVKEKAEGE